MPQQDMITRSATHRASSPATSPPGKHFAPATVLPRPGTPSNRRTVPDTTPGIKASAPGAETWLRSTWPTTHGLAQPIGLRWRKRSVAPAATGRYRVRSRAKSSRTLLSLAGVGGCTLASGRGIVAGGSAVPIAGVPAASPGTDRRGCMGAAGANSPNPLNAYATESNPSRPGQQQSGQCAHVVRISSCVLGGNGESRPQ